MKKIISILSIAVLLVTASCKKNKDAHVPPDLAFKTGAGYTSGNVTVAHGDSVLVGVVITKKEDDLRTLNLSHSFDGASTTTTQFTYTMSAAEYGGFSHDYYIVTRNTPGTEQWIFTVTDRDGNLAQKGITLTVQ